ncbi:DUF4238 domain-containing protein [Mesorhizobium sp. M0955]|uniref:DUF4238 domain-containing protein n=1 Tax=Mesorhizobium sp. M0955 TaxID=2957033 RepID=UPI00333B71C5
MADNKRQHYVPKSTLRHFASDPNRHPKPRQINLVNIAAAKVVRGASLKEQCYQDYFYGKNTAIEKALGQVEGYFSSLVRKMIGTRAIDERDGWHLVQMVALQKARTLRAEEELNGMMEKLIKLFMYNRVDEHDLRKSRIKINNASNRNVGHALALSPLMLDLKRFLLANDTDVPFVIGDNPVVTTNWFARIHHPQRAIGLARSGLQMLLPISPRFALMMHDSNVYTTNSRINVISISRADEVTALNELQWLNAHKNVYFPPTLGVEFLEAMMNVSRPEGGLSDFRRMERIADGDSYRASDKDEFSPPTDGVKSELVVTSAKALSRDVRLRAVSMRNKPIFHDDGSLGSPQRDPAWEDIVGDFARRVLVGETNPTRFWDFVEGHPLVSSIGPWLRRAKRQSDLRRQ